MPTTTPLTDAINALTQYANETTGQSDTTLSDAVGTLVAGYGGGGSATLELLEEVTITENVREYIADFSQYITDGYNTIYGYVDLTLTSADYIYYAVRKSSGTNNYINSWVGTRAADAAWRFSWGKMADGSNYSVANSGATNEPDIVKFRVGTYSGSVYITAGSKIRLYGVKYSI